MTPLDDYKIGAAGGQHDSVFEPDNAGVVGQYIQIGYAEFAKRFVSYLNVQMLNRLHRKIC
jgi:hypothetical protein